MKKGLVILILEILFGIILRAQLPPGQSLQLSFHHGKIIRHNPSIKFVIPPHSQALFFNWQVQTYGAKDWQAMQNYPLIGLCGQYYYLGDREILGNAFSLVPNLSFGLLDRRRVKAYFQVGTGLAFLDRAYDRILNPKNNTIGSAINSTTMFRLEVEMALSAHFWLGFGGSFTHFSNASVQLPNLGINIPAGSVAIKFAPRALNAEDYLAGDPSKKPLNRWGVHTQVDLAYKESAAPGGPKKPVYVAGVGVGFRLSRFNQLQWGLGYEFHRSIYDFSLHTFSVSEKEDARKGATRWMAYVSDEFLFGKVGLVLHAGVYISPGSFLKPWFLYTRLGVRYHLPALGKSGLRPYVGLSMKAHKTVAEYASLGLGINFR